MSAPKSQLTNDQYRAQILEAHAHIVVALERVLRPLNILSLHSLGPNLELMSESEDTITIPKTHLRNANLVLETLREIVEHS